jgi:hypothetical protein
MKVETEDHTLAIMWAERKANRKTIDVLVAALEGTRDHIRDCFGTDDRPGSDSADIVRAADAALSLARKGC